MYTSAEMGGSKDIIWLWLYVRVRVRVCVCQEHLYGK